MAHGRTSTTDAVDAVGHWVSLSDRFLAAAEALPAEVETMLLPRVHLLGLAVEYRLKAFFHAVRDGAPETTDLTRLVSLAGHCGLRLTSDQREALAILNSARFVGSSQAFTDSGQPDSWTTAPGTTTGYLRTLCETISAQAAEVRGR